MKVKPGSIEHRKSVAAKYHLLEQDVLDLKKREFEMLCIGLEQGEKYAARKLMRYIEDQEKKEQEKNNAENDNT